ncbi:hypothetical protein pb186bvf_000023 [Paramecium bursaria]
MSQNKEISKIEFQTDDQDEIMKEIRDSEQCPKDVNILQICSTLCNTIVLSTHGQIYTWGQQADTLGRKSNSVKDAMKPSKLQITPKIMMIAAGQNHVVALDQSGFLYSWGGNQFGQLGIGNLDNQPAPKEIDYFKKSNIRINYIHCGGDSSFALTKDDRIYAWGDNRCFQLGLGVNDEPYQVPEEVIKHPWRQKEYIQGKREFGIRDAIRLHLSRNNNTFVFKMINYWDIYYNQKLNYLTMDMKSEINRITTKMIEMTTVNQKQLPHVEKNMKNDYIISETYNQLNYLGNQLVEHDNKLQETNDEISNLEKDLTSIKQQLFDIFAKETELQHQKEQIEVIIRKLQRKQQQSREIESKQKEYNRIKELFQANDNIKTTLVRRQNQAEEQRLHCIAKQIKQAEFLKDLKSLQSLLNEVDKERRIYLKSKLLEGNKADLEKFMDRITYFFNEMIETSISTMARNNEQQIPLKQMIQTSDQKLQYIKNELMGFKVNSNDESYEILSKILEIFHDNITVRKRLNDYMRGLVMPNDEKREVHETQKEKILREYEDVIKKQMRDLQNQGQRYFEYKL